MGKLSVEEVKKVYRTSIIQKHLMPINSKLISYLEKKPYTSYFEFGCNWGLNLKAIRGYDKKNFVLGMDLSKLAILESINENIPVIYGDEQLLNRMPSNIVDCVFTVSCLDHIPDSLFDEIIANLTRMAKKEVVLVESNEESDDCIWYPHDYISKGFEDIGSIVSESTKTTFIYYRYLK